MTPDDNPDPGQLRAPDGQCYPCAHEQMWGQQCRCVDPCRSPRCSAGAEDNPLYEWTNVPLPRWAPCACCHVAVRSALRPYGPHLVCEDCWDLIGSPACPRAWKNGPAPLNAFMMETT